MNRTQLFLGLALKKEINGGVKAGKRRRSDPGGGLLRKDGIYDIRYLVALTLASIQTFFRAIHIFLVSAQPFSVRNISHDF